jgi:ParB family chromosome partitioning protein
MSNETTGSSPGARKALGKGLGALLGSRGPVSSEATSSIRQVPVDHILPNPYQPRRSFHPERLGELAASIQENGVVQPILLRPATGGKYEIVAGERRWRAARMAGLTAIPALVQSVSDERLLEVALIENIQREDLNPIETAQAFDQLLREFSLTHEQIAQRTGKDRATITNYLRLLKLAPEVQILLAEDKISMGHARALLGLSAQEQKSLAAKVFAQGLSVRTVERMVQKSKEKSPPALPQPLDPNLRAATQELERALGTRVRVVEGSDGRGRFEIDFYSPDDRERIYNLLVYGRS